MAADHARRARDKSNAWPQNDLKNPLVLSVTCSQMCRLIVRFPDEFLQLYECFATARRKPRSVNSSFKVRVDNELPPFDESPALVLSFTIAENVKSLPKCCAASARFRAAMLAFLAPQKRQKTGPTSVLSVTDNFRVIGPREIRVLTRGSIFDDFHCHANGAIARCHIFAADRQFLLRRAGKRPADRLKRVSSRQRAERKVSAAGSRGAIR